MKKTVAILIACVTGWAQAPQGQKKVTLQTFGETDLLLIHAQKGFSTLIEFPEGHPIREATIGDKEFWVVEGKGRFLHVKPAKEGLVTNLNVLLDGDIVYSFLLREISTKAGTGKPDLRVVVNGGNAGDELATLRKDKENLIEALTRSDRAFKELNDKVEAEKKAALKKNDQPVEEINHAAPHIDAPATGGAHGTVPVPQAGATVPARGYGAFASDEAPIASSYVVERQGGIVRTSWRKVKHLFRMLRGN
jgi:hypothetical protein